MNECEYLRTTYPHPEIRKCLNPYYCEYERNNGGCHKYCNLSKEEMNKLFDRKGLEKKIDVN